MSYKMKVKSWGKPDQILMKVILNSSHHSLLIQSPILCWDWNESREKMRMLFFFTPQIFFPPILFDFLWLTLTIICQWININIIVIVRQQTRNKRNQRSSLKQIFMMKLTERWTQKILVRNMKEKCKCNQNCITHENTKLVWTRRKYTPV